MHHPSCQCAECAQSRINNAFVAAIAEETEAPPHELEGGERVPVCETCGREIERA